MAQLADLIYCTRCGRQLDEHHFCDRCGLTFETTDWADTKECKKCKEQIPVNANFCCFCGQDQAFIMLSEQSEQEDGKGELDAIREKQHTLDAPTESHHNHQVNGQWHIYSNTSGDEEMQSLVEMIQEAQHTLANQPRSERKNESSRPGLVTSTKLLLKDTFKYGKKMGRADFWWGYLGMILLLMAVSIGAVTIISTIGGVEFTESQLLMLVVPISVLFYIPVFSATWRRLHDVGLPGALAILMFFSLIGQLIVYVLTSFPHNPSVIGYFFDEREKRDIERQLARLQAENERKQNQATATKKNKPTDVPQENVAVSQVSQTSEKSFAAETTSQSQELKQTTQSLSTNSQDADTTSQQTLQSLSMSESAANHTAPHTSQSNDGKNE